MRKAIAVISALLLASPAWAQEPIIGGNVFAPKAAAVGNYTGPGDVVSGAAAWYGFRAYSGAVAAAATQKVVNLRNTGSNETCDVLIATSGNIAGTVTNCSGSSGGATVSTFCTGGCAVTELYDQSGGNNCSAAPCDVNQTTAAKQPSFTQSCQNSQPCAVWAGAQRLFTATNLSAGIAQPHTYSVVAITNATSGEVIVLRTAASGTALTELLYNASAGSKIDIFAGNFATVAQTNSTWHAIQGLVNSSSSAINNDGTDTTGLNAGTNSSGVTISLGEQNDGTIPLTGDIAEAGVWPSGFNATQRGNMCHNQRTYWSTSGSC